MTPRLQWSHLDKQYASIFQSVNSLMATRDILDARVTWAPIPRLTLEAFANNLTDKTYIASQFFGSSSADGGILYGPRRQVGVRAQFSFGAR